MAAKFLGGKGWPVERTRLVERAIVRHTDLDPVDSPECQIVQTGAALDVAGFPVRAVESDVVKEIAARHPRDDFADRIKAAYFAEISAQPEGVFAKLEAAIELSKLMDNNPLDNS